MTAPRRRPKAKRQRQPPNPLRAVAFHEAAHAVAFWATQRDLGWGRFHGFDRVLIRPIDQWNQPFTDGRGRTDAGGLCGFVECPRRFNVLGVKVKAIRFEMSEAQRQEIVAAWYRAMEADVITYFVGVLAEAKLAHSSAFWAYFNFQGSTDFTNARVSASAFADTDEECQALLDSLFERARAVVRANWPAISAVAAALLDRWCLTGEEVGAIIAEAQSQLAQLDRQRVNSPRILAAFQ